MFTVDWKYRPEESFACTVTRCVPVDIARDVFKLPPEAVHCLTPSTQTNVLVTVAAESVVPATIFTGEVTVEFGAGVQMVTEGLVELSTHDEVPIVTKTVCLVRAPVVSTDCTVSRWLPAVAVTEVFTFAPLT